jgi:hypothetical protein
VCQDFFKYLQESNLYQDFLNQIAAKSHAKVEAPTLLVGESTGDVDNSYNFLMV